MEASLDLMDLQVHRLETRLRIEEQILAVYVARVDTAQEEARINAANMAQTQATIEQGLSAIGFEGGDLSDPEGALDVQERLLNRQQALIDERDRRQQRIDQGEVSAVDKERSEERIRLIDEELRGIDALIPLTEEYVELLNNVDDIQRQIHRDRLQDISNARELFELNNEIARLSGELTDDEAASELQEQTLDFLEQQLEEQEKLLRTAQRQYSKDLITAQELHDIEAEKLNIQVEILKLKQDQNKEDQTQLNALIEMRNEMLRMLNLSGGMDAGSQAQLAAVEAKIRAELVSLGFDDATIRQVMNSMEVQRFAEGGWVHGAPGVGVPIIAGEAGPERIVSAAQVRAVGGPAALEAMLGRRYGQASAMSSVVSAPTAYHNDFRNMTVVTPNPEDFMRKLQPMMVKTSRETIAKYDRERGKHNG